MDGRKPNLRWGILNIIIEVLRGRMRMAVACALLILPTVVLGQAMGKAALEAGGAGTGAKVAAATVGTAGTQETEVKLPGKLEMPAVLERVDHRMDMAAATMPVLRGLTETVPAAPMVAPATTQESKPAASAFEQRAIRPRSTVETSTTTQAAPVASRLPSGLSSAFQVAAALAIVLGLVFVGKALARKYLPGAGVSNGKGVVEVLARYPLCKNQSLVLVRIGTQIIALNQGKEQSQSVLVISDQTEVANIMGQIEGKSPQSIQAGFSNLLANARMDLEDTANDPETRESRMPDAEDLDSQLDEMAAAKRQLMELRQQVRSVRDHLPRE